MQAGFTADRSNTLNGISRRSTSEWRAYSFVVKRRSTGQTAASLDKTLRAEARLLGDEDPRNRHTTKVAEGGRETLKLTRDRSIPTVNTTNVTSDSTGHASNCSDSNIEFACSPRGLQTLWLCIIRIA